MQNRTRKIHEPVFRRPNTEVHTHQPSFCTAENIYPFMGGSSVRVPEWQKRRHVRAAFVMWIWIWLWVSESTDTGGYEASEVRYFLLTWPYHLTTALIYLSDPFCVEETNVLSCSVQLTGPLCIINLLMVIHYIYIYIYAFSRRFYPKRLTLHSSYSFYIWSALAFPGNRTHDLGVANAMLYQLSYRKALIQHCSSRSYPPFPYFSF